MANKNLFQSLRGRLLPKADCRNNAGGVAYKFTDEHALAQYVATGCLNGTFYQTAEDQLAKLLDLASKVDNAFLAQTALYSRREAYMKDTPALLCAVLASRDVSLLAEIFPQVIDNGKMLRNFVQIMRSGVTGRKSLGSAPKRLVQEWLNNATDEQLLRASVGNSPSLADVLKMVHPKPKSKAREAFYGYLIGKPADISLLPAKVRDYEAWKQSQAAGQLNADTPDVPFQLLTAQPLSTDQWKGIARKAPWHMTRMNLNTFARHGVFKNKILADSTMVKTVANRLSDRDNVLRSRAFPYQLLAAYLNAGQDVPSKVKNALQDAMEIALENVPEIKGNVVICPDVSGSMHSPVTGYRAGATTKVRCIDVAALVAAAILRKNPDARVLPFENRVVKVDLNPRDSVMTNAKILSSLPCGGTNCSAPLRWLNDHNSQVDAVIFVSDNESWIDSRYYGHFGGGATETMKQWQAIKHRNPSAKMACIDITPYDTSQAKEREDILNIGGFSDHVFTLLSHFVAGRLSDEHWVGEIKKQHLAPREQSA